MCDRSSFAIAPEPAYGELPSSVFQRLRLSGASLALSQERAYPDERNPQAVRAAGVTSQINGSGTLKGLLSFGSLDLLLAGALGSSWRKGSITNGTTRHSWALRQRLGEGWLYRKGMVIRSLTLTVSQGGFVEVSCEVIYARESVISEDAAAPDDPPPSRAALCSSEARLDLTLPGLISPGVVRSISLTLGRSGATLDFGAGSPFAHDVRLGLFSASASIEVMLRGHDAYEALLSSAVGPLSLSVIDRDGYGYAITFPKAVISNPHVNASGRGTVLMAAFDIEAQSGSVSGGSISVSMIQPDGYRLIAVNQEPILNNNQTISP